MSQTRTKRLRLSLSVFVAMVLAIPVQQFAGFEIRSAHADARSDAEGLFRAGESLFKAGNYNEAADAFEGAFEVLPLPAIAFSAAQAYRLHYFQQQDPRHLKRAVELYRLYVKEQKEGGRIVDATNFLADLTPLLAKIEAQGNVGAMVRTERTGIVVTSPVDGAMASVNGGEKKLMPLPVSLEAGRHKVAVTAPGFAPFEKEVDIVAGQNRAVEAELVALPVGLTIKTDSGAAVRVNGKSVGSAPFATPVKLDAGTYFIEVSRRGHRPFTQQLVGGRGEQLVLEAELRTTRQRKLSYAVLGTGAVFIALSGLTGLAALADNGSAGDLEDKRTASGISAAEATELNRLIDSRDQRTTETQILFGIGLATAAVGGLLYWLDNPDVQESVPTEKTRVVPVASASSAGLALSGCF